MLTTCTVNCAVNDNEGNPVEGAIITATLDRYEVYEGYVVPQIEQVKTDANGAAVLNLWPNELGSTESSYTIKILAPNGKTVRTRAVVPNVNSTDLHLIADLPAYPGKSDGQLVIDAAVAAAAPANDAKIAAQNAAASASASAAAAATSESAAGAYATNASDDAAAAAASAAAASTSESNAATSEANAATSEANASTSEGNASTSEANAATSAASASASASTATTAKTDAQAARDSAASSESNAAASAGAASASATAAAASESSAASSATAAAASESAAAASAVDAGNSASAAAGSAAQAASEVSNHDADPAAHGGILQPGELGDLEAPLVRLPLKNSLLGDLSGSVTFSRASTGTYIDRYGKLKYAAIDTPRFEKAGLLVEGASTNEMLNSSQFCSASWLKTGSAKVVPGMSVAPDGSYGGAMFIDTGAGSAFERVYQTLAAASDTTRTFSVFVKQGSASGFSMSFYDPTAPATKYAVTFTWTGGVPVGAAVVGPSSGSFGVKAVGGGWYLCTITLTSSVAGNDLQPSIYVTPWNTVEAGSNFFWGVQVEQLEFPSSYIPSTETFTSRASTGTYWDAAGVLQTAATDVERVSYNPADLSAPPAQLLEGASTNELTYSEQFDNAAWLKTNVTVSQNSIVAPDGTATGDALVEDTANSNHQASQAGTNLAAGPVAGSVFVKGGARKLIRVMVYNATDGEVAGVNLDMNTGATSGVVGNAFVQSAGNGWYRVGVAGIATVGASRLFVRLRDNAGNLVYTGDGSSRAYWWGAQIEAGYAPTSYIATTTAAVTRAADVWSSAQSTRAGDVCSIDFADNHPALPDGTEFTYLVDFDAADVAAGERMVLDAGFAQAGTNKFSLIRINSDSNICNFYRAGGAVQVASGGFSAMKRYGVTHTAGNTSTTYADGVQNASTATSLNTETGVNQDSIGIGCKAGGGSALFGHVSNLRIYDFALSEAQMRVA